MEGEYKEKDTHRPFRALVLLLRDALAELVGVEALLLRLLLQLGAEEREGVVVDGHEVELDGAGRVGRYPGFDGLSVR